MRLLKRIRRFWTRVYHNDWRHVPPPNWACKRGTGRDYW
jgi:hypothetical protein